MIIVTGPDNAGKTSLIEHLKTKFDLETPKRYHTLPPVNRLDYVEYIMNTLLDANVDQIFDRFYLDEFAYGPVIRNSVIYKMGDIVKIEKLFLRINPLIILCMPTDFVLSKDFGTREQYPSEKQNLEVAKRFNHIVTTKPFSKSPQYLFDYTKDPDYIHITNALRLYLFMKGVRVR